MSNIDEIYNKSITYQRITSQEALELYQNGDLIELGRLANKMRQKLVPGETASYLIDRNINYTNVCNSDCSFCGFYRPNSSHPESYVLTREAIQEKVEEALALGATRILLQGGHNDELDFSFYIELLSWLKQNYKIDLNCFSPSEIHQMHLVSGKSYVDILTELQAAGMDGLPGGGAELLVDSIRKRVSPKKIKSNTWLDIMSIAHSLDLVTTATMVIGFGEDLEDRILHLENLRNLQDESLKKGYAGFNGFISWTLQHNESTSMGRSRHSGKYGADSIDYLRNVAVSRIYLDNIVHHQASWPTLGIDIGKVALNFGCDDFGSTMMEENVVSKAGALTASKWQMSPEELCSVIGNAGFFPIERDCRYHYRSIGRNSITANQ